MKPTPLKIISISRRLDMVAFFPDLIVDVLARRSPPERTHSLVFWSKAPANLLRHQGLRSVLSRYDQSVLHLTVTGMGAGVLEPGIPPAREVLDLLPDLVDLLGDPRRIRLRFDPIVHIAGAGLPGDSNLAFFPDVAQAASRAGLSHLITSWMTPYPKVLARLDGAGLQYRPPDESERQTVWAALQDEAARWGLTLSTCCDPVLPMSACIDAAWLNTLHPQGFVAPSPPAGGQRPRCGCVKSWDIGWYYPCPGGCLYCYGRPQMKKAGSLPPPIR